MEDALRQDHAVLVFHSRQLRELAGIYAQNVELTHAAGDVHHQIVGGQGHHIVGQTSDDVAKEARGEDDAAWLGNVSGDGSADAGFQVVTGQVQLLLRFQQHPLQSGDGAFGRHRSGGDGDHRL